MEENSINNGNLLEEINIKGSNKYDYPLDFNDLVVKSILERVHPGSTILEFGPGMGRYTEFFTRTMGCTVYIVELDPVGYQSSMRWAKKGILGDISSVQWDIEFANIRFDYVIFADVLEHLICPEDVLRRVAGLMKESGQLLISIPNITYSGVLSDLIQNKFQYRDLGILDDTHLHFFTGESLLDLLKNSGFSPLVFHGCPNDVRASEFAESFALLPDELAFYLEDIPHSKNYQYFTAAVKSSWYEKHKNDLRTEIESYCNTGVISYLYYDTGNGFTDSQRLDATVYQGDHQVVIFKLPENANFKFLRWDPAVNRGVHCSHVFLLSNGVIIYPSANTAYYAKGGVDWFLPGEANYIFSTEELRGSLIEIHYSLMLDYQSSQSLDQSLLYQEQKSVTDELLRQIDSLRLRSIDMYKQKNIMEQLVERQRIDIENLQSELLSIKQSEAWRITWPIRYFISKFRQVMKRERKNTIIAQEAEKPLILTPPLKCEPEPIDASVSFVIPCYNAGIELDDLISCLKSQKGLGKIEIIVVDSQSTDGTPQRAEFLGAKVVQILKKDFNHSYSRNMGAKNATGDYLIFTNQDAMPTGLWWARRMLEPLLQGQVVAASLMEQAKPDTELYYQLGIWSHHVNFMGLDKCDRIGALPEVQNHITMRQNANLNDVACAHRRDVFMKYRYRGVYGEDLEYGVRVIKDGLKIGFMSSEKVIHSHNRPVFYYLKRAFVEYFSVIDIIPDLPLSQVDRNHLISVAVQGYRELDQLHAYMQSLPCEGMSIDDFKNSINWYFDFDSRSSLEDIYLPSKTNDAQFDKVISRFFEMASDIEIKEVSMIPVYAHYINEIICGFWAWDGRVSVSVQDREDIYDCLLKHFAVNLGINIYACYTQYPEETDIIELGDSLNSGV